MGKLTGIRAVSFDADGTLWDFESVMRQSLGYALQELERLKPRAAGVLDIDRMIEIRDGVAEGLRGEVSDLERIRFEAFRQTLREVGNRDDALAEHLTKVYLKHRFGDIEPFDDVLPTLTVLRKGFKLGVISNGNSHPERCGLKDIFRFVVLSQDYGVEKPDERIFKIALEEAGCSRLELLHVGDSLENDVGGAIDSGIRGVWLNRDRRRNDTDVSPDHEISSLIELLEIL
jgi:putative hydrolase of the HAD superfamily